MATCEIDADVLQVFKKFKMAKDPKPSALIFRIDKDAHRFVIADEIIDISLEKLQEELSTSTPRYIVYVTKYTHQDGRISYPIVFIYYMPKGISPALAMTYSANKEKLFRALELGTPWISYIWKQ
ncbi:putative actin binding protein [Heterostelium album PN500]|uniref:Putative actin binding protein n=1 Tax=Heterostelium pallidum (strain ATCC 26659 / Pp 5 / PN500) TaxID=670386 RepID=D3B8S7_HETP5|nr:putative actin binding protein [Heterostelium album PN500]EFA82445.1 putative actin binding protein [Heterostelium album PN500]|eukprot:XP_020434562.1 putative actin binding protein [Heterostelium album PN500]